MTTEFAKAFKYYRKMKFPRQEDLMKELEQYSKACAVYSKGTISKWETGKSIPRLERIEALEDIFFLDGQLKEAAGYTLEAKPDTSDELVEESETPTDPLILEKRKEHFQKLTEIVEMLLGDLDTVKPNTFKGKGKEEALDKPDFWIGLSGQEQGLTKKQLDDMLHDNIESTQEFYDFFLWDCLVSHLKAESFSQGESTTNEHTSREDPYRTIANWRILVHRKTFKGTCSICKGWVQ